MNRLSLSIFAAVFLVSAHACAQSRDRDKQIQLALSAAPASIAARATVSIREGGKMVELRHGDNGWTCMPPGHGDPLPRPACFDSNGMAFVDALVTGRAPDPDKPGYSYMLQGGSAWSNLDPEASKLPRGQRDYIRIPPHFMILGSKIANASGLPLREANPDTTRPFVMFGGTRYAILIIPVK